MHETFYQTSTDLTDNFTAFYEEQIQAAERPSSQVLVLTPISNPDDWTYNFIHELPLVYPHPAVVPEVMFYVQDIDIEHRVVVETHGYIRVRRFKFTLGKSTDDVVPNDVKVIIFMDDKTTYALESFLPHTKHLRLI